MKNFKMRTTIAVFIFLVTTVCMVFLYFFANRSMSAMMKQSQIENLHTSLSAQTNIIREYVAHQEDLLVAYSQDALVLDFLKDPHNESKRLKAQAYTEKYYAKLDNWEGLYIGEWNTHVIAHSNPEVVGMVTRKDPDSLKQLQDAMTSLNGLYDAGIIVSPASQKLVLSMYCPVFDEDGKTIVGYVGGGPFADGLKSLLASTQNEGAHYSLLNAASGVYIFDEDESKMTKEIQDKTLLSIISQSLKSENEESGNKEYTDKKAGRSIATYQYMPEYQWLVVSCDSEENIYADSRAGMRILGIICLVFDLLIGVFSWIAIRISTAPLKYVEGAIIQLKQLRLNKGNKLDKYINRKSEVGQIATAIDSLYDTLKDIVSTLNRCSDSLNQTALGMTDSSRTLIQCVEENSYTTELFAKRTESITDTVSQMDGKIAEIADVVSQVEEKIQIGAERSAALNDTVSQMHTSVNRSIRSTNQRMEENKQAIEEVMQNLQSLTHIDEMATQILEITSQTNLLSLNASIEAARAGEAGKGFAVVAGEIGNLANTSSATATEIQSICNDTKTNISKIQECFDNIVLFLQEEVQTSFQELGQATNEYSTSIEEIQNIIQDIQQSSNIFVEAVDAIREQIEGVQDSPGSSNVSTEDVIEKTEQIGKTTEELSAIADTNQDNATSIREIVQRFS